MIKVTFCGDTKYITVPGLTQWDYGRMLRIYGLSPRKGERFEFHFAPEGARVAFRCAGVVKDEDYIESMIPAKLLELGTNMNAYLYRTEENQGMTVYTVHMLVKRRPKPEDYDAPADRNIIRQIQEELDKKADGIQLIEDSHQLQLTARGDPVGDAIQLPDGAAGEVESITNPEIDDMMKGEE